MEESNFTELNSKSDLYISNILDQPKNYPLEYVERAKAIYEERDIGSPRKQRVLNSIPSIKRSVYQKMKYGIEPSVIMKYMKEKGLDDSFAKEIAVKALNQLKSEEPEESKGKGSIILVVFLIIVVLKLLF